MWSEIKQVYLDSRKPRDIFWNVYVARPLAAPLVWVFSKTSITPNQVTFLGALVFLGVVAALVALPGAWGLLVAAACLELAYLFDCADGQLARITRKTSMVGAYLDFLIDEFKALGLVGAFSVRMWWHHGHDELWLIVGILGTALVCVATSLTTFVRRVEYAGKEIKPGVHEERVAPSSPIGKVVRLLERGAQWLIHYPSWFVYFALLDLTGVYDLILSPVLPRGGGANVVFLAAFLGVYALYAAKTGLGVVLKLGRSSYYK